MQKRVAGSPNLGVLLMCPTPHRLSACLLCCCTNRPMTVRKYGTRWGLPSSTTLLSVHATFSDPGRPLESRLFRFHDSAPALSVLASMTLNMSPSAFSSHNEAEYTSGVTDSLWPAHFPVYTSPNCYQLRRKTRYWWAANPYQIKTSFSLDS